MRNADGVYLVYDITSEKSFKMLDFWYDCIKKSTNDDIVIFLLGNKSDLKNQKNFKDGKIFTVPSQKAMNFVKDYNLQGYVECSAKENVNIAESFKTFYKSISNFIID
jgi:GTPase SAR1 family protein